MSQSILQTTQVKGPLSSQGAIRAKGSKKKKDLFFSLNLTALIDTFSILVIFLLSVFNGDAQSLNITSKMSLPVASKMELMTMGTVIRIEGNIFYVDEKPANINTLVQTLIEVKNQKNNDPDEVKNSLIIQADRRLSFDEISPVIRAGGQAGFSQYKFAVMPGIQARN